MSLKETFKNIFNKNLFYILLGILFGFFAVVLFFYFKGENNYYAVFFNNGNVYFGRLSFFPKLKLDDALYIEFVPQGQPTIRRFKDAVWKPSGSIYLNKDSIMFVAPIDSSSDLIKLIKNQFSLQPTPDQNQTTSQENNLPGNQIEQNSEKSQNNF